MGSWRTYVATLLNMVVLVVSMSLVAWATSEVSERVQVLSQVNRREVDEISAALQSGQPDQGRLRQIHQLTNMARASVTTLTMYGAETPRS